MKTVELLLGGFVPYSSTRCCVVARVQYFRDQLHVSFFPFSVVHARCFNATEITVYLLWGLSLLSPFVEPKSKQVRSLQSG